MSAQEVNLFLMNYPDLNLKMIQWMSLKPSYRLPLYQLNPED